LEPVIDFKGGAHPSNAPTVKNFEANLMNNTEKMYEDGKWRIGDKVTVHSLNPESEVIDGKLHAKFSDTCDEIYVSSVNGTISDYVEEDGKILYIVKSDDNKAIYHRNEDEMS
jgi:hypothetical protein